jgi:hypothetical protein
MRAARLSGRKASGDTALCAIASSSVNFTGQVLTVTSGEGRRFRADPRRR